MENYIGAQGILAKKKKFIMSCLGHFYFNPPQFVRGEMQYLFDDAGKKYLDMYAGVSVINCGHCNPFITEKIIAQIKNLSCRKISGSYARKFAKKFFLFNGY